MWMVHVVDIIYSGHGRAEQLPEKLRPGKGKYYDSYFTVKIAGGSYSGALEKKICQQLKIKKEELSSWKIVRRSLDARKKPDLKFVYVVDVDTPKNGKPSSHAKG